MQHAATSIAFVFGALAPLAFAWFGSSSPLAQEEPALEIPLGLPQEIPGLDETPRTRALARLGEKLFFDENLSVDHSTACASCHPPAHNFASPARRPRGAYGRQTPRAGAALINRALGKSQGWTGAVATLEELALLPFPDENEFDLSVEEALTRIEQDPEYVALFHEASGRDPDPETVGQALAAFVRTILVGDSPVDRFLAGDFAALNREERLGLWIYESKGGCWRCHSGQGNYTDESFHNTGVGVQDGVPEEGRHAVTGDEADRGRFKTPTLRGVALTAPYMHDGSFQSLEEVVEFYRRGGNSNPHLDPRLEPLSLTDAEAQFLVAFLRALSRS